MVTPCFSQEPLMLHCTLQFLPHALIEGEVSSFDVLKRVCHTHFYILGCHTHFYIFTCHQKHPVTTTPANEGTDFSIGPAISREELVILMTHVLV